MSTAQFASRVQHVNPLTTSLHSGYSKPPHVSPSDNNPITNTKLPILQNNRQPGMSMYTNNGNSPPRNNPPFDFSNVDKDGNKKPDCSLENFINQLKNEFAMFPYKIYTCLGSLIVTWKLKNIDLKHIEIVDTLKSSIEKYNNIVDINILKAAKVEAEECISTDELTEFIAKFPIDAAVISALRCVDERVSEIKNVINKENVNNINLVQEIDETIQPFGLTLLTNEFTQNDVKDGKMETIQQFDLSFEADEKDKTNLKLKFENVTLNPEINTGALRIIVNQSEDSVKVPEVSYINGGVGASTFASVASGLLVCLACAFATTPRD